MDYIRMPSLQLATFCILLIILPSAFADVYRKDPLTAVAGGCAELHCPKECTDGYAVWSKKKLGDDFTPIFGHNNCTLAIKNFSESANSGIYVCTSGIPNTEWPSETVELVISDGPRNNGIVRAARQTVECSAVGNLTPIDQRQKNLTDAVKFANGSRVDPPPSHAPKEEAGAITRRANSVVIGVCVCISPSVIAITTLPSVLIRNHLALRMSV